MPKLKIPAEQSGGVTSVRELNDIQSQSFEPQQDGSQGLSLADAFNFHADKWLAETANMSSIQRAVLHSSYQRIIGMGRPVLPFIFERLSEQPNHWFWALRAITGEDPVDPSDAGRIKKMAEVWLNWARDRHLNK